MEIPDCTLMDSDAVSPPVWTLAEFMENSVDESLLAANPEAEEGCRLLVDTTACKVDSGLKVNGPEAMIGDIAPVAGPETGVEIDSAIAEDNWEEPTLMKVATGAPDSNTRLANRAPGMDT